MKIWFRIHGYEPCSWTSVWEYLSPAFIDLGVELYDIIPPDNAENCIELWWGDPQFWHWSDLPVKARVSLALSEARSIRSDGRLNVISNLKRSDLIICPSESAATAFREAPLDTPIRIALFGVDTEEFAYIDRKWDDEFVFLHAGLTQFRKGSWLVPEAFLKAFTSADNTRLIIAAPRSSPMFTRLKGEYGRQPNIDFINERQDSLTALYSRGHVYVSPHLSEGFGLMIPEAMSTGMACLVARCSSPREYFSREYGWWIEMSEDYASIKKCLPETSGFWRLPELESLAKGMRRAYMNRQEARKKGEAASEYVSAKLTWESTANNIINHIKEMLDAKNISSDVSPERRKLVTGPSGKYQPAC
jgi:glycosyltransferase involved in cell wall biosynthesis